MRMDRNRNVADSSVSPGEGTIHWEERRAELEKEVEENRWRLPETLMALGVAAMAQGDHDGARSALVKSSQAWQARRILNEDPPVELGILLWQLGERDEARHYL